MHLDVLFTWFLCYPAAKTPKHHPCPSSGSLFMPSLSGAHLGLLYFLLDLFLHVICLLQDRNLVQELKGWCSEQAEFCPEITRIAVCWWE